MVARILEHIDFDRPGTIIELGAGTGPITVEIIERLRPHHRFVLVENDPDFCDILRRRFPTTPLIQTDASKLAEPLARMGIKKELDAINVPSARGLRHLLCFEKLYVFLPVRRFGHGGDLMDGDIGFR